MQVFKSEIKVGLLVLISFVLFVVGIFVVSDVRSLWDKKKTLTILFEYADGITAGSPVWYAGFEVGGVKEHTHSPRSSRPYCAHGENISRCPSEEGFPRRNQKPRNDGRKIRGNQSGVSRLTRVGARRHYRRQKPGFTFPNNRNRREGRLGFGRVGSGGQRPRL